MNLHTDIEFVERQIHLLKNKMKANLEDGLDLREIEIRHEVLRFTVFSVTQKTPLELHCGREAGTNTSNLKNTVLVESKDSLYNTKLSW